MFALKTRKVDMKYMRLFVLDETDKLFDQDYGRNRL